MPTLRDYIASLSPEEQAQVMDLVARNAARQRNIDESPVLGRAKEFGYGVAAGLGNALKGAVTFPAAVTNALGITDFEAPKTPLLGPDGNFLSDPVLGLGVGPFYGTGNVLGFAASFFTGAGELKAAQGAGRLARAAAGAFNFGVGTTVRSQGDLGERLETGAHAVPLGAAMGIAAVPRAAGEGLGKYVFKTSIRTGVAGAAAGAVVPGTVAPVEATQIPLFDNFLFNAAFGAVASARAKEPRVPGRETAQAATAATSAPDAAQRARAGDMQRKLDEQAKIETQIASMFPAQLPLQTRADLGKNLFGEVQGTQRGLFDETPPGLEPGTLVPDHVQRSLFDQAAAAAPETTAADIFPEPTPPRPLATLSASPRSFEDKLTTLKRTGVNHFTAEELRSKSKELQGLGGVAQFLGQSGKGTVDELVQRILSLGTPLAAPATGPRDTFVFTLLGHGLDNFRKDPKAPSAPRSVVEAGVRSDLATTPSALWQRPGLRITIVAPGTKHADAYTTPGAEFHPMDNTLTLYPRYFTQGLKGRQNILVHEGSHEVSLMRGLVNTPVARVAQLYTQLGFPTAVNKSMKPGAVVEELATQIRQMFNLPADSPITGKGNAFKVGPIPFYVSSLRNLLNAHRTTANRLGYQGSEVFFASVPHDYFLQNPDALTIAPINGRHYAYTSPAEVISELSGALATGADLRSTPAALELLDLALGGREKAFIFGQSRVKNLRTQGSLFPDTFSDRTLETPGPAGGPTDFTFSWTDIPGARMYEHYTESFRTEVEGSRPWSLALTRPARPSLESPKHFTKKTTALDAVSYAITVRFLRRLNRFAPAKAFGAFDKILSDVTSLVTERALERDAAGEMRSSIIERDLFTLLDIGDIKSITDTHMAQVMAERATSVLPEGKRLRAERPPAATSTVTAADLAKITHPAAEVRASTTDFSERVDPVKVQRLDATFGDGILGLYKNAALDDTIKKILLWRFGHLYKNPDGSLVYPKQRSIGSIARSLSTTERNVRKHIQDFASTGLSDSRTLAASRSTDRAQSELFEGLRPATGTPLDTLTPDNHLVRGGVVIRTDDPAYDYVAWKHQISTIDRTTGEVIRTDVESRRGTRRTRISYPREGRTEVQHGLFDDRRAAFAEAAREATKPEPAAGPEPSPPTPQERVMEAALGEAESGPLATSILKGQERAEETARRGGLPSTTPELGVLFGDLKGAIKPTSRLGEFLTFEKARARIGTAGMLDDQFASLHLDQQLRHTILRLSAASNTPHYAKTLAKYSRLLNAHASESGAKVPFPTLAALTKVSTKRGQFKQGNNRTNWMDVIRARTAELGTDIQILNPEKGGAAKLRLTEPETGRQITTRDVGSAALFLDARSRRLLDAVDLMPAGFHHLRITLPAESGPGYGPPPPPDAPTAADHEERGRPPDIPEASQRSHGDAFWSQVRPTMNYAAHLARKLGNMELAHASKNLLFQSEQGRNHSQAFIQRRINTMKKWGVRHSRQEVYGKAAADVDIAAENELKATQDISKANALVTAIEDSIYAAHALPANEIGYLKEMRRVGWDPMFRRFDIGVTQYIHGYFTRVTDPKPTEGTVVLEATFPTAVLFFSRMYRKGLLQGRSLKYNDIYDRYARQGFREKYVGTAPGAGTLSPVERLEAAIRPYELRDVKGAVESAIDLTDDFGRPTGRLAKQFEPLVRLMSVARGIPDSRRLNAVEAQSGITKTLANWTDAKTQAAIESSFIPFRSQFASMVRAYNESLNVKLSTRTYDTYIELFTRLNRARTFGLHFGRALRNGLTDGLFTLARVGPKYYGAAISDVLTPKLGAQIYRRAYALGVIKPAFPVEYISTTNAALTHIEKLSFMFSATDHWGRVIAFRAQELRTRDAAIAYRAHGSLEKFRHDSGLSQLDPAWDKLITEPLLRGNYPAAIREHAKLLADTALYDYTNANAPLAFRGVWGRFLGQYIIWPINTIESFHGLVKWGTREQKLKSAATYAAGAAAIYGMGAALGIKTAQWIPFVHNLMYTGGPGLGFVEEVKDTLAGDPATQQRVISDLRHDPNAFFLGLGTRYLLPAGDVLKVLASQTNMSRRRRRLLGIPKPESNPTDRIKRLLGFIPASAPTPKTQPLIERLGRAGIEQLP